MAIISNGQSLRYDPKREELLLKLKGKEPQPFNILSDGQRSIALLRLNAIGHKMAKGQWIRRIM
ncbi:hypothetical protein LH67_05790 [Xenorhabdus nematophila]|nr:hypothetical protein LH67_05790 [Xenorhabdus nematophila]